MALYIYYKGCYHFNDGRNYTGFFINNLMKGFGVYIWADGTYEGMFDNDKRNGYGIYTYSDGSIYEGWWMNGKLHGPGKLKDKASPWKYGLWKNGENIQWLSADEASEVTTNEILVLEKMLGSVQMKEEKQTSWTFSAPDDFIDGKNKFAVEEKKMPH